MTFEEKNARALAKLDPLAEMMRRVVRVCAPPLPEMPAKYQPLLSKRDAMTMGRCNRCNPPPKWYECSLCGYCTREKWMYDMHNRWPPEWCGATARKRARTASEMRPDYVRMMSQRVVEFDDELKAAKVKEN